MKALWVVWGVELQSLKHITGMLSLVHHSGWCEIRQKHSLPSSREDGFNQIRLFYFNCWIDT